MSRRLQLSITAVVVLAFSSAAGVAQNQAGRIDGLVSRYLDYGKFNGSVLVAENGQVILTKGYGYANFEWDIPCSPDTKFRLGSITKQFTAMLILRQVERGQIALDDPMGKYLPGYPKHQADRVTVRQLLNHTSGIPNYTEIRNPRDPHEARVPRMLDSLIAVFSGLPLEFEPGTRMKYSNSGYVLLGKILENVTGRSYERLLQEEILIPLGMKNTGYDHASPILRKRAAGYEKSGGLRNAEYLDMSIPYAAGAMYSTVEDLLIWDQALYTEKLLSEKWKREYFRPGLSSYALGWTVRNMAVGKGGDSVWTISHGGGINGFSTLIVRVPEKRQLIVILNNTGGAPLASMATGILGILHGKPYAEPKQSAAREFEKLIASDGMPAALTAFDRMKADPDAYEVSEAEINDLGYRFLNGGDLRSAITVFKVNVGAFPKSWNVYDSLGEALAADGRIDLAIENYEKSLELNPKNTGGRKALQDLKVRQVK